ncbi:hypothetical protein BCR33DRAFT_752989 [Rhizoclosmatium globosum]|uniref:DNA mismatch repair protein MSH3 n=1 Tax=Rhizoclosmatium globosum TaxID=329046 RepID=A0A1Y2CVH1_9FUNG|nr:hypothetical protein BCR33DRAFT_752989 [Rhizoclosmatium globosum]|eukprot:ORY50345.1 hypothetical protein BCR33DRAFT_752989 [Rhizoclosmatium globosum]
MDEDEPEQQQPKSKGKGKAAATPKSGAKTKYTPLEQQYLDIRRKNPGVLLAVEVGYKYRFFEEDALTASKELNIVAYMDKNLRGASIPVHRLNVHVSKLVQLGYKVGIVRQTETAALKAAGDNRSAPFERKLTNIFTKGTFIDSDFTNTESEGFDSSSIKSSYIMVVWEDFKNSNKHDDKVTISIVAVQLSTGEVIYDSFEDGVVRSELETRLEHVNPIELILPLESLSSSTERLLAHWASRSECKGNVVRMERLKGAFLDASPVLDLPSPVIICLSALLYHLVDFGLEHVLLLTKGFTPFSQIGHMVLSGTTLKALEIFETEDGGSGAKGTLMWVLDHTVTKFGGRLLRRWVSRPLVDVDMLRERIGAVEEVIEFTKEEKLPIVKMRGLLYLEKSLARIHYTRCPPSDLIATLLAFHKIATTFPTTSVASQFTSSLLKDIFSAPSTIRGLVERYLSLLDQEACTKNAKRDIFTLTEDETVMTDARKEVKQLKEELKECEGEFGGVLEGIRKVLKKRDVEFVAVSGVEYLVEVKVASVASVPKDWVKVNGTKAVSRFHTPAVLELLQSRDIIVEKLNTAADAAYLELLGEIAGHYQELKDVVQSLAVVDCLMSLAKVASQPGYVKPTYSSDPIMEVKGGRHPMVELLIPNFVENDVTLTMDDRCLLITGPNMGGKSSYIRQVALLALLGQIGSYLPAQSAHLGIFDSIHTRMGAYDDITRGQSTFMKELSETSEILRTATPRSLVILDELGRGTSTHDGTAIAWAVLKELFCGIKCATLFVTHYPILGGVTGLNGEPVRCVHMGFLAEEERGEGESVNGIPVVTFLYKVMEGLAGRSFGLNVARMAGIPREVVERAGVHARKMEELRT